MARTRRLAPTAGAKLVRWRAQPVPSDQSCGATPELTEFLMSLGATPEQIAEAADPVGPDRAGRRSRLRRGRGPHRRDLADRAGASVDEVLGIWRALGVDVPGPEDADVLGRRREPRPDAVVGRPVHRRREQRASARRRGAPCREWPMRPSPSTSRPSSPTWPTAGPTPCSWPRRAPMAARTALELGAGLGAVFAHLMRDGVDRQRRAQAHVSDRALFRVAVGFVDLVGFTPLSHRMGTRELSTFIGQFENRAFRLAAEHGGRIIKHIGDEVMFVAIDPVAGCELALALMAEFVDDGIQPRGGLAFGDVVARQGDYYGEVVNLASRLADLAIPGEVLADDNVRMAAAASGPSSSRAPGDAS